MLTLLFILMCIGGATLEWVGESIVGLLRRG